jgi:exopolysaccharide biosynthesis polyprenyl glycosylphosphotransferase
VKPTRVFVAERAVTDNEGVGFDGAAARRRAVSPVAGEVARMSTAPLAYEALHESLDARTREILHHHRSTSNVKGRGWLMRRMLLASDLLGLTVVFAVAELIYSAGDLLPIAAEAGLFALSLPLWVVAAKLYGLYDRDEERADHSTADDVVGVFHLVTVGTWLLFVAAYITRLAHPQLPKLLTFWVLAVVAIPLIRSGARSYCRHSIHYLQNTIIVGAGDVGQQIARKLIKHPEYGINVVGFVDGEPKERDEQLEHLTVLGDLSHVPELVRLLDVERVIVAFSRHSREEMVELLRDLNELRVQVDIVPRFFDILTPAVTMHAVEGLPLLGVIPPRLERSSAFLKRALDVAGAAVGLIFLSPLFAVAAVAIKLDSRGPVLFRQVRMGVSDRTFEILKFRTMVADADARKADVAYLNKHAGDGGDVRMFKIDFDPRVTRVGNVLRRFSIDELPQLWNVIRGEMSLVGPRPLILDEHEHVTDWAERRLDLRPGITGLWQVLGRDDIPFAEMVKLDYLYVTTWSLAADMRLLLRTMPLIFARRGA